MPYINFARPRRYVMRGSREGQGVLEHHTVIERLSNTGPDPLQNRTEARPCHRYSHNG